MALLALGNLFGGALDDDVAALVAPLRTEVDDVVGALDDVEVMLDDDHRVAVADELVKRLHQRVDVVEVQTRRRLVKDEQRVALSLAAQVVGELHALVLAARERRGRLP